MKFSPTHFIEVLRDVPRPTPSRARRHLAKLAAFYAKKVEQKALNGDKSGMAVWMDDLAALMTAVEAFEEKYGKEQP